MKRIGRYLKATHSRGFILDPSSNLKINCYPDPDFDRIYGYKKTNDLSCVKSRTDYVITEADCLELWQSKLQHETALSTMEADVIALAYGCRELLQTIDMVAVLGKVIDLPKDLTTIHVLIHEDNAGALILA